MKGEESKCRRRYQAPLPDKCAVVINNEEGWIGDWLNIPGVRVWADKCQLVARTDGGWMVLAPPRHLPLEVPPMPKSCRTRRTIRC